MSCPAELRVDVNSSLQVTLALLNQGEFSVVSKINNALITAGHTKESADVAGVTPSDQELRPVLSLTPRQDKEGLPASSSQIHMALARLSHHQLNHVCRHVMACALLSWADDAQPPTAWQRPAWSAACFCWQAPAP